MCQYPNPYEYTWSNFLKACLYGGMRLLSIRMNWALQENKPYKRKLRPDKGWKVVRLPDYETSGTQFSYTIENINPGILSIASYVYSKANIKIIDLSISKK